MSAMIRPGNLVFECEEPEVDSAIVVIRERWENGRRIILKWRYVTDDDSREEA